MISVEQALIIHKQVIEKYGGAIGLRDSDGLKSALARPFQTFDKKELYTSAFEKAAAIGESIILNHPFVDGNKRMGYILMEAILRFEGYKINAIDSELYVFIISIAEGKKTFKEITEWLQKHSASLNK
jgi:death-on-curing protein